MSLIAVENDVAEIPCSSGYSEEVRTSSRRASFKSQDFIHIFGFVYGAVDGR